MPESGPNNPDHVFERDGRHYVCWMQSSGANPLGLADPARAEWHVAVDGRQYALFEAAPEDLSYARIGDFEERVHDWYEANVIAVSPVERAEEQASNPAQPRI